MYKILLVDDEYLVRETLKTILRRQNNIEIIDEAASGKSAMEKFNSINPDMVIVDITVPGMNVIDFVKYMKRTNRKNIILLLKDYGDPDIVSEALTAGANESIMKPTRPDDFVAIVQKYLPDKDEVMPIELTLGTLMEYVYNENYKKAVEQLKVVAREVLLLYRHDRKGFQETAEYVLAGLQEISRRKQLSIARTLNWYERAKMINFFNMESELSSILEEIFKEIGDTTRFVHDKKLIQSVLNYIEKNYQDGVTLEEAAEHVHISPFYLSKLFKKELKINFISYVMERKIEKAKDLLENTDMPVLNIAMELNYKEANYFSKVFKKVTGMTPSAYRKKSEKRAENGKLLFKRHHQIYNGNWYV